MGFGPVLFDAFFSLLTFFLDWFKVILVSTGLFGWFIAGITMYMGVRLVAQPLMGIRYGSDLGNATKNAVNRFSSFGKSNSSSKKNGGD